MEPCSWVALGTNLLERTEGEERSSGLIPCPASLLLSSSSYHLPLFAASRVLHDVRVALPKDAAQFERSPCSKRSTFFRRPDCRSRGYAHREDHSDHHSRHRSLSLQRSETWACYYQVVEQRDPVNQRPALSMRCVALERRRSGMVRRKRTLSGPRSPALIRGYAIVSLCTKRINSLRARVLKIDRLADPGVPLEMQGT